MHCDHSLRPPQPPEQKEPAQPAFREQVQNHNTLVKNASPVFLWLSPSRQSGFAFAGCGCSCDRGHRFGVIVDRFLGERNLRVSPLDHRLGKVPNVNSSSVLDNGWPVLIVDVEDLIRSIDNLLSGRRLGKLASEAVAEHQTQAPLAVSLWKMIECAWN